MTTRFAPVALSLLAVALSACEAIRALAPHQWERVPGLIDTGDLAWNGESVPDTVAAGVRFELVVVTWGSSSCTRPAPTEVRVNGLVADAYVFDQETFGECKSNLAPFPRAVGLVLPRPGEALIRVHGAGPRDLPVIREFGVTVR